MSFAERLVCFVDVDPGRDGDSRRCFDDVISPTWAKREFIRIHLFKLVDHALIKRSIAFPHLKERSDALVFKIVVYGAARAILASAFWMRRQKTEPLLCIWRCRTREWIELASQRSVSVHAASRVLKEYACATVIIAHLQHGSARFRMSGDKLRRCHSQATCKS